MQTKKLQDTILIIAQEVDNICRDNDIKYIMIGGTQLGAIRHLGFIPWDDDFDIAMKRSDYDRFLKICKEKLDTEKYYLQTRDRKEYAFEFAKVQLNNTELREDFSAGADVHRGIFVDVFPYDNLPRGRFKKKVFLFKNHILKNLIWVNCNYGTDEHKKKMTYKICRMLGKIISVQTLKKKRLKLITRYNELDTNECFASDYPNIILDNEWFSSIKEYPFETCSFYGFESYDEYLKRHFGDYMVLPPENERVTHTTVEIDFGQY